MVDAGTRDGAYPDHKTKAQLELDMLVAQKRAAQYQAKAEADFDEW